MRLAVVTTPPSTRSGIGDYTRGLLEHLKRLFEVRVFVAPGLEGEELAGLTAESVLALRPREQDQLLFQLGNERDHAFMSPLVRSLGGVVALHDWVLFDLAVAARPELARGGLRGHLAAWREGGLEQLAVYREGWRARRRARATPLADEPGELPEALRDFMLIAGWHAPEREAAGSKQGAGRWTADRATVRLPDAGVRRVRLEASAHPGRTLRLSSNGTVVEHRFAGGDARLELPLEGGAEPEVALDVSGLTIDRAQRARGDARRLGCYVRSLGFEDAKGWHAVDLEAPAARPLASPGLEVDRFRLPFNRSIVRFADSFVVHSEHVRRLILTERNAPTPVAVVPHGTDAAWRDGDRRAGRVVLELPVDWREAFLLVSFGAVQGHKRIDALLGGLALALEARPDMRLALVGRVDPSDYDVRAAVARAGLEGRVHLAGYVDEARAREWLHAADLCVQLRGPSTGGSSGGAHRALSAGRAVIASDLDEQRELPSSAVRWLAPGPGEAGRLSELLVELRDDPARRQSMEAAARRWVRGVSSFERAAAAYAQALQRFPRPRGHKRRMFAQRVRAARRQSTAAGP